MLVSFEGTVRVRKGDKVGYKLTRPITSHAKIQLHAKLVWSCTSSV